VTFRTFRHGPSTHSFLPFLLLAVRSGVFITRSPTFACRTHVETERAPSYPSKPPDAFDCCSLATGPLRPHCKTSFFPFVFFLSAVYVTLLPCSCCRSSPIVKVGPCCPERHCVGSSIMPGTCPGGCSPLIEDSRCPAVPLANSATSRFTAGSRALGCCFQRGTDGQASPSPPPLSLSCSALTTRVSTR